MPTQSLEKQEMQNIVLHTSSGVQFHDGPPNSGKNSSKFEDVESKIKLVTISSDGNHVAWISNVDVFVTEGPEWKQIGKLHHPKAVALSFSPQGSYLAILDMFVQKKDAPAPENLSIYNVAEKKLMKSFSQKNHDGWEPQWTKDEFVMGILVTSEVHFYEDKDFDHYKKKKVLVKMKGFSLSPSIGRHAVVFFMPPVSSSPAYVHLYKYPAIKDNSSIIASKSFFKVDTIEYFWNVQCTAVLLLATSEVDKSGNSYYGDQALYFLNIRGDSNRVTFSKQGNIRSVCWCPSGKEFFCVYGFAPAKATIFNIKSDPVLEFGEGARNLVLVNPQGNLALIGAMGNISSRFEIWDIKEQKLLGQQECPDITCIEWLSCGQHILTSTCSPRLRVNNGYKIWHYTTSLLFEKLYPEKEELYLAKGLPCHSMATSFTITTQAVKGIESRVKKASMQRYIPPSQRVAAVEVDTTKKFLSERDQPTLEKTIKQKKKQLKKQKQKEKQDEEKKKKEEAKGMLDDWRKKCHKEEDSDKKNPNPVQDKDKATKRLKNIKKKLAEIENLKVERDGGKVLVHGELKKLQNEESYLKELEELSIT